MYANEIAEIAELEKENVGTNLPYTRETDKKMSDQLPRVEEIGKCSLLVEALPCRSKSVFSFCLDLFTCN